MNPWHKSALLILLAVPPQVAHGQASQGTVTSGNIIEAPLAKAKAIVTSNAILDARENGPACLTELSSVAVFTSVPSPRTEDPACIIANPVKLISIRSQPEITFSGQPTLSCAFGLTLSAYTITSIIPASTKLGSKLKTIHTGPGFHCRRRNNLPDGKLSEHSFGNAIDIAAFTLESGAGFTIGPADKLPANFAEFQTRLRSSACQTFTTVLGPGENPTHNSHLHFDLARLKRNQAPYRLCQ